MFNGPSITESEEYSERDAIAGLMGEVKLPKTAS